MKLFSLFLLFSSITCFAQDRDPVAHSSTTISSQARYEIVQSSLAARWTFRVDRVCGNIGQLATTASEGVTWEPMFVSGQPRCTPDGKIRYQLFSSGLAARHTFLMNTENGRTWQLQSSKDSRGIEFTGWFPFEE
jgi:hypothetical protein